MAGTFTLILFHVVFSTKRRMPWLTDDVNAQLYPFIGGIVRDERGSLLRIGRVEDHIHMLIRWRPDGKLADLIRDVKTRSSRWMHEARGIREFAWQEGYGGFSVSASTVPKVTKYIDKQREHHAQTPFVSELAQILKAHGVEFDPQHLD